MIKDIKFKYKKTAFVNINDLAIIAGNLRPYITQIKKDLEIDKYNTPESFTKLVFDPKILINIKKIIDDKKSNCLKYVVVVGIGGSSVGTRAIYESLFDQIDSHNKERVPKIIFLKTVSSKRIENLKNIIKKEVKKPEEILVNMVSKSGNTIETNANFEAIYAFLKRYFGEQQVKERIVITTDKDSKLHKKAKKESLSILEIPKRVVGRYSVFSAVGMFPLALCGINIEEIFDGARKMGEICLRRNIDRNPALASASLMHLYYYNELNIHNSFFFAPELESLGKWYRQLVGESLSKEKNIEGEVVNAGITPVVSVGSVDLHSVAQLYLAGPRDKITTFIYQLPNEEAVKIPDDVLLGSVSSHLRGKNLPDIMSAILKSTIDAYGERKLPFTEIIFPEISGYTIGQYMQMKMFETIFLAKLLEINAFDQPNVEEYKRQIGKYL